MVRQHPNEPSCHSSHFLSHKILRLFFILLVFFSLLALMLINLVGQELSYANNKTLLAAETQNTALKLEQRISHIENVMARLTLLASAVKPQQLQARLKPLLSRKNTQINVLAAYVVPVTDGSIVTLKSANASSENSRNIIAQYQRQSWFIYARGLPVGGIYWSAPVGLLNSDAFKVLVSSPYAVNGNIEGVIVMQVKFTKSGIMPTGQAFSDHALLLDSQNRAYLYSNLETALALQPQTVDQLVGQLGISKPNRFVETEFNSSNSSEKVVATHVIEPKTQWKIMTIVPQSLLMSDLFAYQSSLLLGLGTCILVIMFAAWYVINRVFFAAMQELDEAFEDKQLVQSDEMITSPYQETNVLVEMLNTSMVLLQQKRAIEEVGVVSDKRRLLEGINSEIKTPIHTILSSVSLLKKSNLANQDKEYIGLIEKSAKMSMTVIDNVTNYSKIISGDLVLQQTRFDLFALLDQVYTSLRTKLSGNLRVRFSLSYPEDGHRFFYGDPERLQQVLIDLVSNALKFTSRGFVELKVESKSQQDVTANSDKSVDSEMLVFAITDTGIGMPQSKIDMLLQPPSIARYEPINFHKPGLTLSICHRLILLMGGKLSAESVLGEGTTFKMELLLPQAEQLGQQHLISSNAIAVDKLAELKVLLIDDNKINQVLAQKIFHMLNMQAYIGANIADAQQLLKSNQIDIIYLRSSELTRQTQLLADICSKTERKIPIVGLLEIQKHFDCSDTLLSGLLNMPLTRQALIEETVRVLGFQSPLADVLHPLNQKVE